MICNCINIRSIKIKANKSHKILRKNTFFSLPFVIFNKALFFIKIKDFCMLFIKRMDYRKILAFLYNYCLKIDYSAKYSQIRNP
jgi:hypothetical protein